MTTSYLAEQLKSLGVDSDLASPVLSFAIGKSIFKVYCPSPDEYRITADVVQNSIELGASFITYAESWCEPTMDGAEHAQLHGVELMPYKAFFKHIQRNVGR